MDQEQLRNMVRAARKDGTVCAPATLLPCGDNDVEEFARCAFPKGTAEELCRAFQAAPQFAGIDVKKLLRGGQQGVRAVLVSESPYYARQAAMYLAAIAALLRKESGAEGQEDDGDDYGLCWDEEIERALRDEEEEEMKQSLAVAASRLLDPAMGAEDSEEVHAQGEPEPRRLNLAALDAPALLLWAESGPVLSRGLLSRLAIAERKGMDLFVAVKPNQADLKLLDELSFYHHFRFCRVQRTTDEYLRCVLREALRQQGRTLARSADPDRVMSELRRSRGVEFEEGDIYALAGWAAAENPQNRPLDNRDLSFRPFRLEAGERAWDRLRAMTGLEKVKETLRRHLASDVLLRRQNAGTVLCRSMAFSGPPGTGKSVTARLVAEILREEGCGTGRFVEAGREQLIGKYMGHTSPKIAKLFRQAKGGVLFIDEAGALIPWGHDSYAEEAVNALVRHMELDQDTVVIFATYPEEMRALLESNPGLSSRVAKVVEFEAYTEAQLWEILTGMAKQEGYAVPPEAEADCLDFFRELRRRKGDSFGNGREARRLFQSAVEELALRALDAPEPPPLSAEDLSAAAKRLLEQEEKPPERVIGF